MANGGTKRTSVLVTALFLLLAYPFSDSLPVVQATHPDKVSSYAASASPSADARYSESPRGSPLRLRRNTLERRSAEANRQQNPMKSVMLDPMEASVASSSALSGKAPSSVFHMTDEEIRARRDAGYLSPEDASAALARRRQKYDRTRQELRKSWKTVQQSAGTCYAAFANLGRTVYDDTSEFARDGLQRVWDKGSEQAFKGISHISASAQNQTARLRSATHSRMTYHANHRGYGHLKLDPTTISEEQYYLRPENAGDAVDVEEYVLIQNQGPFAGFAEVSHRNVEDSVFINDPHAPSHAHFGDLEEEEDDVASVAPSGRYRLDAEPRFEGEEAVSPVEQPTMRSRIAKTGWGSASQYISSWMGDRRSSRPEERSNEESLQSDAEEASDAAHTVSSRPPSSLFTNEGDLFPPRAASSLGTTASSTSVNHIPSSPVERRLEKKFDEVSEIDDRDEEVIKEDDEIEQTLRDMRVVVDPREQQEKSQLMTGAQTPTPAAQATLATDEEETVYMPIEVRNEEELAAVQALHESLHAAEAEQDLTSSVHPTAAPPLLLVTEDEVDVAPQEEADAPVLSQEEKIAFVPLQEEEKVTLSEQEKTLDEAPVVKEEAATKVEEVSIQEDVTPEEPVIETQEPAEQAPPVATDKSKTVEEKDEKPTAPPAPAPSTPSQKKNDKNKKKKKKGKW